MVIEPTVPVSTERHVRLGAASTYLRIRVHLPACRSHFQKHFQAYPGRDQISGTYRDIKTRFISTMDLIPSVPCKITHMVVNRPGA